MAKTKKPFKQPVNRDEVMAWWNARDPAYEWSWVHGAGRCNRDDESGGLYVTLEDALAHRPKQGRLWRLDPFREWVLAEEYDPKASVQEFSI